MDNIIVYDRLHIKMTHIHTCTLHWNTGFSLFQKFQIEGCKEARAQ